MAIFKETSFWGKKEIRKNLKPGSVVTLLPYPAGDCPIPVDTERVIVVSSDSVDHVRESPSDGDTTQRLSGRYVTLANLETKGALAAIGIKSKVVYELELPEKLV